jgi:hypothetical protein
MGNAVRGSTIQGNKYARSRLGKRVWEKRTGIGQGGSCKSKKGKKEVYSADAQDAKTHKRDQGPWIAVGTQIRSQASGIDEGILESAQGGKSKG